MNNEKAHTKVTVLIMAGVAERFDGHILNKSKELVDLNDKKYKGKIIGLYFSAHWCPPCRNFTPILNMPWLALDYKERTKKSKLSDKYNVREILTLILLDGDSRDVVCTNAKKKIQFDDTEGKDFPWKSS
ncbi:unnamed protein product [Rotaria sp. Silwood1]|nr:unnamed protein product [Rotaria sp. Silwood1]